MLLFLQLGCQGYHEDCAAPADCPSGDFFGDFSKNQNNSTQYQLNINPEAMGGLFSHSHVEKTFKKNQEYISEMNKNKVR